MDDQRIQGYVNELTALTNNNNDQEAYSRFREIYNMSPLVNEEGDDILLGRICNPIGLELLHTNQQLERERDWWQAVISVMVDYDTQHGTNLHKGLVYHNMTLPLLELNQPETAAEFLLRAVREDDRKAGNREAKGTPAYNMACFLIPIVETHQWRNDDRRLSQDERDVLIAFFHHLFTAFTGNTIFDTQRDTFNEIRNTVLRDTLLRRYDLIHADTQRENFEDPPRVAIYAGSIIEGFLTFLLQENFAAAITEYRRLAGQGAAFVSYLFSRPNVGQQLVDSLVEDNAPLQGTEEQRKNAIELWNFGQKIKVARGLGIFGQSQHPALGILCQLLREYRNIVHPTNNETLGTGRDWDMLFEINSRVARMLKTALDIVLHEFHRHPTHNIRMRALRLPHTPTSLASPCMPAEITGDGRVIPLTNTTPGTNNPNETTTTQTSSTRTPTTMGSVTTTTTDD